MSKIISKRYLTEEQILDILGFETDVTKILVAKFDEETKNLLLKVGNKE